jgi:putative SOS response-associated peptidase YedK
MTKPQDAVRQFFPSTALVDRTGNLPPLPGIFPDYSAPIVRTGSGGRELVMARWGMPTPPQYLVGKRVDAGVTNIRRVKSPHGRFWLGPEHRCVVPFTSFAENELLPDGSRPPVWFALDGSRPLAFFAGLWTRWTSVRNLKEGAVTADLFGFLTTEANAVVGAIHPKAMPVILTAEDEVEQWLTARPMRRWSCSALADDALQVVARERKEDGRPAQLRPPSAPG